MLYFSDVLRNVGIAPDGVLLMRHPVSNDVARDYYKVDKIKQYKAHQTKGSFKKYQYFAAFIGDKGTRARFYGCYKVNGWQSDTKQVMEQGDPHPEHFQGQSLYFDLTPVEELREYENKLIIDWGNSSRRWYQKGTNKKPIWAIIPTDKKVFDGYESLVLKYDELRDIVENPEINIEWKVALSSVNAVYLIVDRENGRQYIGSSYGNEGLWGRWQCYVNTLHAGNKKMKDLICQYPERYHQFQFSILQILPKQITPDEAIQVESLYKRKLMTREFGMNLN